MLLRCHPAWREDAPSLCVPTYAGFGNGDPLRLAYLLPRSVRPRKPIPPGRSRRGPTIPRLSEGSLPGVLTLSQRFIEEVYHASGGVSSVLFENSENAENSEKSILRL